MKGKTIMSNNTMFQHNVENDEVIVREFTDAEQAERDAEVAAFAEAKAIKQAKADEDAAKRTALLERLGITEDEAKLLLG
jgi:hypothetical protein